jgi:prevent-host-death family protein
VQMVGVKELKNRLTFFLRRTKEGERVIVTDRGAPVAVLHSLEEAEPHAGPEERLAVLARRGLIRLPRPSARLTPFSPVPSRGKAASDIVIEERR